MNSKWNSFEQNADKKAVVEARPCIRHNVYLVLNFINESKFFVASTRTEYNRPSAGFKSGDLYSGWLDSKAVQNICLNIRQKVRSHKLFLTRQRPLKTALRQRANRS